MKIKSAIIHALGGVTREEHESLLLKDRPKPEISFYTPQIIPLSVQTVIPKPDCLYNLPDLQNKLEKKMEQKLLEAARPYIQFVHYAGATEHRCKGVLQIIPPPIIAKVSFSKEERTQWADTL